MFIDYLKQVKTKYQNYDISDLLSEIKIEDQSFFSKNGWHDTTISYYLKIIYENQSLFSHEDVLAICIQESELGAIMTDCSQITDDDELWRYDIDPDELDPNELLIRIYAQVETEDDQGYFERFMDALAYVYHKEYGTYLDIEIDWLMECTGNIEDDISYNNMKDVQTVFCSLQMDINDFIEEA
jgi:hypothetical protein